MSNLSLEARAKQNAIEYEHASDRATRSRTPVQNTDVPEMLMQASRDICDLLVLVETQRQQIQALTDARVDHTQYDQPLATAASNELVPPKKGPQCVVSCYLAGVGRDAGWMRPCDGCDGIGGRR